MIAKKFSNEREDFFVIGFTSRPVLQVKHKDTSGQHALTYIDAVAKFGASLSRGELQVAYGRAGVGNLSLCSFSRILLFCMIRGREKGNLEAVPRGGPGPVMGGWEEERE